MKEADKNGERSERSSSNRLNTLTDCIFALAMIALFFFIDRPPEDMPRTDDAVFGYLRGQADIIITALVTFMLLGFYWVSHHNQGKYIKQTDMAQLWLTMVYLLSIALLPFPSALSMRFADSRVAQIFYSLDIFFIGVLSLARWIYASGNRRLVEADLDSDTVSRISREALIEPCGALLSIGGAFINTYWWQFSFVLVPIAAIITRRIWGRSKKMI
jgi:uncharacterized membrane protein